MPGGLTPFTALSPLEAAGRYIHALPEGAMVAVALSGGGDSVGLLTALHAANDRLAGRIRLAAVTVDHALRPQSADEATAMGDFCRTLSVPHVALVWEGEKPEAGVSEAARQARYHLLAEGARRLGVDCLVTAHTLDDQLETVEMRRQRSDTSLRGLAGIAPAALFFGGLAVHRPFLRVKRGEIRDMLAARGVGWFDDPTNDDPHYERVRVRQAGQFVLDAEAIAAAAHKRTTLSQEAADYLASHGRMPLPLLFELDLPQDSEAENLVLATLIAVAGGQTHLPGQEQLGRLRDMLLDRRGSLSVSLGRTVVERRKDKLFIARDRRNLPTLRLPPGGSADWDGRFHVTNTSPAELTIGAMREREAAAAKVQGRIDRRALATLPDCAVPGHHEGKGTTRPLLAPFERVLTSFDRPLADALCRITGRPVFPAFLSAGVETFLVSG
ncbi:MAG TPA: tRNA lysidine(34) synthetase TilS [Ensifer sp.]|nr:tRNA lysidine(34) synthetase TilS [Ensifer sp.]